MTQVLVKPLEWPDHCMRGERVQSKSALVKYTIAHYGAAPDSGVVFRWADENRPWSEAFFSYEGAIAAAQADYERRIRSALVAPLTAPVAERDEATKLLRSVSTALVGLTPNGSEYYSHSRALDIYYADVAACERVIRERFEAGHKAKLSLVVERRRAETAESQLASLIRQCEASGVTQVPAGTRRPDLEVLRKTLDALKVALATPLPDTPAPVTVPVAERDEVVARLLSTDEERLNVEPYSCEQDMKAAAAIITADKAEIARALGYATSLLVHYVNEHCNPVPEWKPLPDLIGVLTQIDNATTVTREIKARAETAEAEIARLTATVNQRDALVERLKEIKSYFHAEWSEAFIRAETAESQLATLKAERDGLVEALKPFADRADSWDSDEITDFIGEDYSRLMLDDLCRAREALEASKERT